MIKLYSPRAHVKQSFKDVHKHVVPKQSMTVKEIFARFLRKEYLPIAREGVYEERYGDLEKLSKKDIFDQMEVVKELKRRATDLSKPPTPPLPTPPTPPPAPDPNNPSGEPKPK